MPKKILLALNSMLLAIAMVAALSGCATFKAPPSSAHKTSKIRAFTQIPNLPVDYPTKYLPDGNVWQDFARDMRIPVTNNSAVREQIRWWINNQSFLNNVLTRGAQYFYYIYQQAKVRHIPAELALLPVFESGYVPVNRSNRGAVGLWQFMPPAARDHGIRMDRYFDGRNDVIVSTNAAFKYLTYLYYYFERDWLLAIAAYDTGPGNLQRALFRNQRSGKSSDFWSLQLHRETKAYVPKLLALAAILKNPRAYGVNVVPIDNGPYFSALKVNKQISLNQAAKISGASEWSMRMLNAGYVRGITDPDGLAILLVPKSNSAAFKAQTKGKEVAMAGAAVGSSKGIFSSLFSSNMPAPVSTPAVSTPSSVTIRSAAPIVASSASTSPKSAVIFTKLHSSATNAVSSANQLAISAAIESEALANSGSADGSDNESATQDQENSVGVVEAGSSAYNGVKQKLVKHTVAKGETLFSIARRYNTTTAALRRLNRLHSNNVHLHQVLSVQTNSAVSVTRKPVMTARAAMRKERAAPIGKRAAAVPSPSSLQTPSQRRAAALHAASIAKNARINRATAHRSSSLRSSSGSRKRISAVKRVTSSRKKTIAR